MVTGHTDEGRVLVKINAEKTADQEKQHAFSYSDKQRDKVKPENWLLY